jgi:cytokinin dehydrogenase
MIGQPFFRFPAGSFPPGPVYADGAPPHLRSMETSPSRRAVLCAGLGVGAGLTTTPAGAVPPALTIDAASIDFGRLVTLKPRAVDRPAAADVAGLLREATANRVKVAPRGQGHSIYGRPLVEDGLVLDMGAFNTIGPISADRVTVGAGVTWRDLLDATLKEGLAPPVLTNYLGLSVGGTLAIGGIGGSSSRHGLQTDQVLELDVVTADGRQLRCSPSANRDLFDAVRAGLGQCGIVTAATLRLVRAPSRVRRFQLFYRDLATLAAEQRRLLDNGRFDQLQGAVLPGPADGPRGGWRYQLDGAVFHDGSLVADDRRVLDGLSDERSAAVVIEASYRDDALAFDKLRGVLVANGQWSHPQPWLLTFLPGRSAEAVAREILDELKAADIGPFGRVTFYPMSAAAVRTPLVRLPDEGPDKAVVFVLNIIRIPASNDRAAAERMVAHNRRLYERIRDRGGVLYPVSALPMSMGDWQRHFGPAWSGFQEARRRYDPAGILTPGYL